MLELLSRRYLKVRKEMMGIDRVDHIYCVSPSNTACF